MLTFLNLVQLVLYIALLALVGQGALYVLAGQRRENNVFYKLLQVVAKPFTWVVRKITPKQVADAQVPVVTFERADLCVTQGLVGQPGCR